MTDIAKKCMAVGMIYAATDNPNGNAASWNHVLNLGWGNTEASWNSQLAFGVGNNDGAYYRLNSGNLVGTRWRALEEVQFVQSASMRILAKNHEFRKISGGNAWNAEVRSQNSYTSDCYISFRAGQVNAAIMVGFAQDPAIDANYTSLNYCIYIQNNGNVSIYESGSQVGTYGTYVAGDEFRLEYVDNQINYYHNQRLLLSRKNVGQRKLYFDSSFHGQGGFIYDTYFGRGGRARSIASSWIDGQRYMGAALNINDATDTGSYWPWLRQTNTAAARWFSLGQLSSSVYLMSSPTNSTANNYTFGWRFDGSNGDTVFNDSATRSSARTRINGRLVLNPYYSTTESYSEGLRINKSNNDWATISMGGANGTESGTGASVWLLGVNGNTFYLSNNGSNSATYRMQAENTGHWRFHGTPGDTDPILDVIGQSAPATWNYGIVTRVGSLTAGKHIYNPIGVNYSTRNMVGLDFYYAGSGSTSNYLGFEIIGAGNAARFYCDKHAEFYNHTWLKYATPNLYLMDTNTAADTYSIIRFGTTNSAGTGNQNAAYIFLNGPARTSDGGANVMTIRNNVGNLRLNNSTYVTGSLTVGQDSLNTSYNLYVNGTSYLNGNANVCKVYNSSNYNSNSSLTLTQLAAYNNASCGMIYAATDNPRGAAGWVHVWSQAWSHGVTSSWVSQIALNVADGAGMWYRTTSGNIAGRAWIRVLDTNNYASVLDSRYVNVTGDTMTGDLRVPQLLGNTWVRANYNASGTDGGLTLYGSDVNYGIIFRTTANCGTHGWVNGDWATYFTMSNTSGRGWVFRRWGSGNVASISTDGNVNFNGALYCGNYIQTGQRIICGYDSGVQYSVSCSGWFRSSGNSGWYNASHNVGIYADDSTYLKSYGGKIFHSSRGILADSTVYYGINSLQYFNVSTSTTSGAATAAVNPYNDWFYHIRMNHANGGGYYGDQAWCFHSNSAYYRRIVNGVDQGWVRIWLQGNAVTGAVWNDYAEYRQADTEEAGYVLYETGKDDLKKTTERLQHFAGVSSDTWGFSQGETEKAKTPIAVAGRVLVYPYQDRNNYQPGDCVCAAPGGTVDIMTREEVIQYPDRIVGTVSCVPDYEEWGGGELADRDPVKVNGRIWIKVR
jgi:hypothetical protein